MATNRRLKRATASTKAREVKSLERRTFYRITPILEDAAGQLVDSLNVSIIDCGFDKCRVWSVPTTTSVQSTHSLEEGLTKISGKPNFVVSRNVRLCKVEKISGKQVAELVAAQLPKAPTGKTETTPSGLQIVDKRSSAE